ncbi:CPBP family glutamic-type intramembrane protease [Humidisolicoccus flavus]|uniref:CPBP family glutamic-type intramembrane protease n=1 Tax=Humidisolicoccus flavus TaxID=3111414 RepID=UPI003244DC90
MTSELAPPQSRPWWAIATALTTMVAGVLVLRKAFENDGESTAVSAWGLALAGVWILGGIALALLLRTDRRIARPRHGRAVAETLVIGAVVSVGSFVGGWILLQIPATESFVQDAVQATGDSPELVLLAALIAGAAEEVFFRIGLSRLFTKHWRWILPNIIYTLVTLGTGNLALVAVAPVLGLASSFGLARTGRWYTPIGIHAMWSLVMVGLFANLMA